MSGLRNKVRPGLETDYADYVVAQATTVAFVLQPGNSFPGIRLVNSALSRMARKRTRNQRQRDDVCFRLE